MSLHKGNLFNDKNIRTIAGGGKGRETYFRTDGSSGDSMIPTFTLHYILFRKNRSTHIPIAKELCPLCAISFMYDKGKL